MIKPQNAVLLVSAIIDSIHLSAYIFILYSIAWVFLSQQDHWNNNKGSWQRSCTLSGIVQHQELMY